MGSHDATHHSTPSRCVPVYRRPYGSPDRRNRKVYMTTFTGGGYQPPLTDASCPSPGATRPGWGVVCPTRVQRTRSCAATGAPSRGLAPRLPRLLCTVCSVTVSHGRHGPEAGSDPHPLTGLPVSPTSFPTWPRASQLAGSPPAVLFPWVGRSCPAAVAHVGAILPVKRHSSGMVFFAGAVPCYLRTTFSNDPAGLANMGGTE